MKTTPTLGLKLYDGTDAPDLVSGYNASMSTIDGSGVLASHGEVQDSTDWDTIVDAGYYSCADTQFSSANHSPVGSYNWGVLVVYKRCDSRNCVTQIYYPHAGDAANRAPVSRAYYYNAWSAWAPLVYVPDSAAQAPSWADVTGKPFDTVGTSLTTSGNVLDLSTAAQASLVPEGGAAGQVLVKNSNTDHDAGWVTPCALPGNICANADGSLLLQGAAMRQLQLSDGSGASAALQGDNSQLVLMKDAATYGQYSKSAVTLRNSSGSTYYAIDGDGKGVLENVKSINGVPFDNTIYEYKTLTGLTAWLRAFSSTGEWWSGPGEVTITANGSTQQYTGNWTVYRTPSIGNAYFQGSEGRAATAHFASLKTDHNANCWAFVMSIKDTEPTFQYVGSITPQLTAMLKRVTTFDAS